MRGPPRFPFEQRTLTRAGSSGSSFGASPLRQEIGLGQARAITRVEVSWPATGETRIIRDLAMDRCYAIRADNDAAREIVLRSFAWPTSSAAPPHHHVKMPDGSMF